MTKPHKHCPACGVSMPMEERVCSQKCEQLVAERQRKIMRTRRIMYIILAAIVIIYVLYALRGKLF